MKKENVVGAGQIKVLCAFSAACVFALPSLTLAEVGLVAAYTFNEGSGTTVADVSGNNNTGTLGSGVTWSAQGKFGNTLVFNGASLVTVPHSASLNLTTGMTLEAWVFPTTASPSRKLLWKDWPTQQLSIYGLGFGFGASSNSPEGFFTNQNGIPVGLGSPPDLPLNAWSHLAATYDAATSTLSIYVDGALRDSRVIFSSPSPITTSTGALRIGGNTISSSAFFQGRIDEVRIYNRALSQAEIQTDMNAPVALPTADTTPPTATTALTATAVSTSQITLTWSPATDNVGVTGYRVERCQGVSCTTFAQIATPSGTTFSNTGLTPTTSYSYRVRAADAAGNLGAYSNIASATPPATDMTPPTAPPGLTATAVSSSQVNLSWTASTDNLGVTGYRVERCQGAGCTNFAQIATPSQTSYSDFGLTAATSYSYRVRAVDAAGNLGAYSIVSVTTQSADTTPPTAPSGLTATAANGQRIDLSWTASTDNAGVWSYRVERCQGASCTNFAQILSSVPTSVSDGAVSAAKTYRYRVRAQDTSGNLGAYSNIASATTPTDTTPPTAPSGLTATPVSSSQINLSWTASTDNLGVYNYEWFRCQGASCTNFVLVSNPRVTSAIDTGRAASTTYRYRVRAKDVAGNASAYSNIASATTQAADTTFPTAPSGLTASVTSSQVNLSWTASTDNLGVTGYRVERCQGAGCTTFAQVGTSTIVSFSDTGLTAATSYSYRVRAADATGNLSAPSNVVSVTTQAASDTSAPTSPTALTATAVSASQINLGWTASTDNVGVTGYRVERCQGAGCTGFMQVGTPTVTSFNDTGLAAASYSYRVRATDAAGNLSAYSSVASATASGASLTVTNPAPGAVVASDTVTVSGTFFGPNNTGITVNGIVAAIVGNTFVAANVPLQPGANTLTATLTTPNNQTATQTLSVTSTGPAAIEVVASPTQGVAPLSATFALNNRTGNAIQSVQADYSGTGSFANVNPTTLSNNYTASGIYQAAFIITDSTGATYQRTAPVVVQDTAQIDQMLQTAWGEFSTALGAGDITQALKYFNTQAQGKFLPVFQTLAADLPQIVASFSPPQPVSVTSEIGEYAINRTIAGADWIFFIYFLRDADGVWRIDDM